MKRPALSANKATCWRLTERARNCAKGSSLCTMSIVIAVFLIVKKDSMSWLIIQGVEVAKKDARNARRLILAKFAN